MSGHDELLSRLCLPHSPMRPLSALPGRKRDHPDDDKTDVGVDAVLSADVDGAPKRQRQYTAPVHALLQAPHPGWTHLPCTAKDRISPAPEVLRDRSRVHRSAGAARPASGRVALEVR